MAEVAEEEEAAEVAVEDSDQGVAIPQEGIDLLEGVALREDIDPQDLHINWYIYLSNKRIIILSLNIINNSHTLIFIYLLSNYIF